MENNFEKLIKAIEEDADFDYSHPETCVGSLAKVLLGYDRVSAPMGGNVAIRKILNVSRDDADYIFWAGNLNVSYATKEDAIRIIREIHEEYEKRS